MIHTDVIRVWNFTDPDDVSLRLPMLRRSLKNIILQWLLSEEFRALIANGVDYKIEGKSNTTL